MADDTVKRLLVKLGISTSEWKAAVRDIQRNLKELNEQAKKDAREMKDNQKQQISLTKQQIDDQKRLAAESKAMAEFDKAKAAWQKQQQEAIKTKVAQAKLETEELKKQAAQEELKIRLEKQQIALQQQKLRLQKQQSSGQAPAAGGHGGGGGMLGHVGMALAGAMGGGPIGMIAAGASMGQVITDTAEGLLEHAVEAMHKLAEGIIEATGPAAQLREQFEKLAQRAGEEPDEMLDKLRRATRGLADDVALYRIANNYMQQGLKVTNEDIIKLIGSTVDLARAQGRDATVAIQALERASKTGRTQILAMVTGLSRQELALKGVSGALDSTTRKTLEFNHVLEAEEARLRAIGTPATTLPELLKQLHNVQKNFIDDLAISITKSQGYKDAIASASKVLWEMEPVLRRVVEEVAKLTDVLELVTPIAKLFVNTFKIGYNIAEAWEKLIGSVLRFGTSVDTIFSGGKASKFRQFIAEQALGMRTLAEYANRAAIRIEAIGNAIDGLAHGKTNAIDKATRKMADDLEASRKEYLNDALSISKFGMGIDEKTPPAGKQDNVDANAIARSRQIARLNLQIAKETNKLLLDETMERLKAEETAVKTSYEQGEIDLKGKVAREKEIYMQEHAARLAQIEEDRKDSVANIILQGKESMTPKSIIDRQITLANRKAEDEKTKENTQLNQKIGGLDEQVFKDGQEAYKKYVQELTRIAEAGVQERLAVLEKEFSSGRVDAEDYLVEKRDLINQEYLLTKDGLEKQIAMFGQTEQQKATLSAQITAARLKAEKELAVFDEGQETVRIKYLETEYETQKKIIEFELRRALNNRVAGGGSETAIQEELITLTDQYVQKLEKKLMLEKEGSENWLKISEEIEKANNQLMMYTQRLVALKDIGPGLGTLYATAGNAAELLDRGRGGQGAQFAQLFRSLESASQAISRLSQSIALQGGPKNYFRDFGQSFTALFHKGGGVSRQTNVQEKLVSSTDKLRDSVDANTAALGGKKPGQEPPKKKDDFGEKLGVFMQKLNDLVGGIMGLYQGLTSGKTGAQGALSGGMAGMQFGAQFGPWGALAGGIGGAVFGGIFGAKEKHLQQDINKIKAELNSIVSDLQAGTISLSQAIADLRRERENAIQVLSTGSNSKKGGKGGKGGMTPSQAQQVIAQIDSQIQQLVNQQTQILQQLHSSLMELAQPVAFQEYVQGLDSIIEKYKEFASAAQGNSAEVANANQYLVESLQQYVNTLSVQLNQAQQTAIQDALTLINLEYQRQQIINQEAQQEYDILSQGVLTRQRTTAMTKGQEIGQLRYQRDMQLQQIDEQIALQKYKVDSESKIFDLAQTRIGLESQLLAAQEEQANYQIAQVQALAQVVADLSSGLSSGQLQTDIQNLMSGGAMPTGPGILYTLLQELGLAGNVPISVTQGPYGTQNWLAGIPSNYASAAQYVASLNPDFMTEIMNKKYTVASAEAKSYESQGIADGYDMAGLIAWLDNGGKMPSSGGGGGDGGGGGKGGYDPRYTGYAKGTSRLTERGPILVGEEGPEIIVPPSNSAILPNPVVNILNTMLGTDGKNILTSKGDKIPPEIKTMVLEHITRQISSTSTKSEVKTNMSPGLSETTKMLLAVGLGSNKLSGAAKGGDINGPVMVGETGPEILLPPLKGTVLSNPIVNVLNSIVTGKTGVRGTAIGTSQQIPEKLNSILTLGMEAPKSNAKRATGPQLSEVMRTMLMIGAGPNSPYLDKPPVNRVGEHTKPVIYGGSSSVTNQGSNVRGTTIVNNEGDRIGGPSVVPAPVKQIFNWMTGRTGKMPVQGTAVPDKTSQISSMRASVEKHLTDLTAHRTNLEMQVVTARTSLLNSEMQYLQMLQETHMKLSDIASARNQGGGGDFEALFQKLYETRGRYGGGGFRREFL